MKETIMYAIHRRYDRGLVMQTATADVRSSLEAIKFRLCLPGRGEIGCDPSLWVPRSLCPWKPPEGRWQAGWQTFAPVYQGDELVALLLRLTTDDDRD